MYLAALAFSLTALVSNGTDFDWTDTEEVQRGTELAVAYRAALVGDTLLVEAKHGKSWHTYAMDNPLRAKAAGGNTDLGLELPTVIDVSGGLEVVGGWYQSKPRDLSDASIGWYTWGFEGTSYFAAKVRRTEGETADVVISAQACSENACRMVDRLTFGIDIGEGALESSSFNLKSLEKVKTPQKASSS